MLEKHRIDALYCAELIYLRLVKTGAIESSVQVMMQKKMSIPFEIVLATNKGNIDNHNLQKIKQTI